MINYSIIIPHKNIPDLLQRCLDSIPRREDVQIIVVDDNSDADKVDFANFPGLNDLYVEVIFGKNENGRKGAGYARNLGLEKAKGKWLVFADADDFFMPCFNEVLDKYVVDDKNDIIYFKVISVDSDTYISKGRGNHLNRYIDLFKSDPFQSELMLRYKFGEPWGKIIKKFVVDQYHLQFDEIVVHNDTTFSYLVGFYASKIAIDEQILYCVTMRAGSIINTPDSVEREFIRIAVFGKSSLFFKKHNIPVEEDWHFKVLLNIYLNNHSYYNEAKKVLLNLGYSKTEINRLLLRTYIKRFTLKIKKIALNQ